MLKVSTTYTFIGHTPTHTPAGDASKAHGALSNALHTVVAQHYAANPDTPITNRSAPAISMDVLKVAATVGIRWRALVCVG